MSEDSFVAALRSGDEQAFRELVRQNHRRLVQVASSICGQANGEEVVQEAWIAIHHNLPTFEGRSRVTTWIYTIVCNGAKTRMRKESRQFSPNTIEGTLSGIHPDHFDDTGHWASPPPNWDLDSPDQLLEEADLQDCIQKTVDGLPANQRAVFILTELEQENSAHICNTLELSDSNVRVLLHRARVRLMQMIDTYRETGKC